MTRLYAVLPEMNMPFHGAKIALLTEMALPVILRDARPDIPWPGYWDLPGGGREGCETPVDCARRETFEELNIEVRPDRIVWGRSFLTDGRRNWFFCAHLRPGDLTGARLGDEGQRWELMPVRAFLGHQRVVPHFRDRLRLFLEDPGG